MASWFSLPLAKRRKIIFGCACAVLCHAHAGCVTWMSELDEGATSCHVSTSLTSPAGNKYQRKSRSQRVVEG
ncbi:hypothetical protein HaLaN_07537 [Haematococcus lacustris]|uniref:Secreted protein n=1 Tax=Haematococcus lacustris TaxID=44745 RepID=A0A699YP92_HAELA|nr:hypothetical protein HaLaN_07537 [Haematococcus lacustris]